MSAVPAADPGPRPASARQPPAAGGQRLAWLDALRGFAALCVVFDHLGLHVLQPARTAVYQWVDTGKYGVFVFFLVSGYIVPASLERKGSVRSFWVSRAFRLYPLYLLAVLATVAAWRLGWGSLRGAGRHPVSAALGHALMLSNVLGVTNVINVIWTLSYEMAFYLLLTALFVAGWHRRSSLWAGLFAVAAVAVGGLLPMTALSDGAAGRKLVVLLADAAILGGLALATSRGGVPRVLGAVLAAGTGLLLVAVNGSWIQPWEALGILALMFTGTVVYRAEQGQLSRRWAAAVAAAVFALVLAAGVWHGPGGSFWLGETGWIRQWACTLLLAGLTFAAGLAVRRRRIPGVLAWLGLVSYSIYLLHPLLIGVYVRLPWVAARHPVPVQVALAAGYLAVLLALCALTYRLVEAPMQRCGKRLAGWLEHRYGPDPLPERARPVTVGADAR
ncbi:MAG: acyltransferase family protein [Gemmatimonadota bacterium]